MNNVTSDTRLGSKKFYIYVDGSLHAMIDMVDMIVMQSYKMDKDGAKRTYNIELYYPTKTILFKYEDNQLFLDILNELNKYL